MHTANGRKEAKACNVVLFEKRVGLSDEGIRSPGSTARSKHVKLFRILVKKCYLGFRICKLFSNTSNQ